MKRHDLKLSGEITASFNDSFRKITEFDDARRRLTKELKVYESKAKTALNKTDFIHPKELSEILETSRLLLNFALENASSELTPIALAAVDYVVNESDACEDFEDENGLQDDLEVVRAVKARIS